jgi:hypothetical protein
MAQGYGVEGYDIPQSRGIPPVVRYLFVAGIILIFFMGFVSVHWAHEFHVWPAMDAAKIPLSGLP